MSISELISVIIPAYNVEDTITECIESVQNQTYKNTEIIVVDDGSTDQTANIIKTSFSGVTLISIPHKGSPGYVRNRGIKRARGAYISFIDADDYWEPDVLDILMDGFARNPDAMLSYGTLRYQGGGHSGTDVHTLRSAYDGYVFDKLLRKNFIQMHPVLVKRKAFDTSGWFDESLDVSIAEDYDLWLRIAYHFQVVYCPQAKGYYRIREGSQFHKTDLIRRNNDIMAVLYKMKNKLGVRHPALYKRMAVVYATLGRHYLADQQLFHSLGAYIKSAFYVGRYFFADSSNNS